MMTYRAMICGHMTSTTNFNKLQYIKTSSLILQGLFESTVWQFNSNYYNFEAFAVRDWEY